MADLGGMEDIVAADSAITWIDGQAGELRYRGYEIGELAQQCSYEEVAWLIWTGELPTGDQVRELQETLRQERMQHHGMINLVRTVPAGAHPLDVLRYVVSWDALGNPLVTDNSPSANFPKAH